MTNSDFLFIAKVLEGKGYMDIPTIYGITKEYYPEDYNRIKSLVDNNADIRLIEVAIIDAYRKIFDKSFAKNLYPPLDIYYFDFSLNAGEDDAARAFQESLNKIKEMAHTKWDTLKVDGVIGKHTQKVYKDFIVWSTYDWKMKLFEAYRNYRRWFYTHNKNRKLRCSWINRTINLDWYILERGVR